METAFVNVIEPGDTGIEVTPPALVSALGPRSSGHDARKTGVNSTSVSLGAFALAMEAKLRVNDHKMHWRFLDMRTLSRRLTQEREELRRAVEIGDPAEVLREAADVANFCMMTADMVRRYPKTPNV